MRVRSLALVLSVSPTGSFTHIPIVLVSHTPLVRCCLAVVHVRGVSHGNRRAAGREQSLGTVVRSACRKDLHCDNVLYEAAEEVAAHRLADYHAQNLNVLARLWEGVADVSTSLTNAYFGTIQP